MWVLPKTVQKNPTRKVAAVESNPIYYIIKNDYVTSRMHCLKPYFSFHRSSFNYIIQGNKKKKREKFLLIFL